MKKDVLKRSLKLQLHRETLRTLEQPQLQDVVGGYYTLTCACTGTFTCFCTPTMQTRCC
jgi:hypothetical protein